MIRCFAKKPRTLLCVSLWGCAEPNITKGEDSNRTGAQNEAAEPGEIDAQAAQRDSGVSETEDPTDQPCAVDDPIMEMGTGEAAFVTIADGDAIEVIHGTQDGHHILGSVRTKNTAPIVAVRFRIIPLSDGIAISDQTYRVLLLPDASGEPCTWSTVGMYAYLGRIDPGTAAFLNNTVEFRMDLVDDYGQTLSQSLQVVPFLTPVERDTPPGAPTGKR